MTLTIADVARQLEAKGTLIRQRSGHSAGVTERVRREIGRDLPGDLEAFYREGIARVGDFLAVAPVWRGHAGWGPGFTDTTRLLHASAVPIFSDGCGSYYGLDLEAGQGVPGVYFFDHEDEFRAPRWAAGSSLARFLLLLAEADRARDENRPAKWELAVDPDLERCARAPAIWEAAGSGRDPGPG